jgi:hypothetical protein
MEKQTIELAFGQKAGANLAADLESQGWADWDFKQDLFLRIVVDRNLPDEVVVYRETTRRREVVHDMTYKLQKGVFPDDVTDIVNLSYAEVLRCYEMGCFLAAIGLCGKTIETVLGSIYEKLLGIHPSKDKQKPGFNAIINAIKREGYDFGTGIKERMELVALHRNMAVHGNIVVPTIDEARSVIYTTRDVLRFAVNQTLNKP